jgi:hypothetical protein
MVENQGVASVEGFVHAGCGEDIQDLTIPQLLCAKMQKTWNQSCGAGHLPC